jgi:hypothetical protein
MGIKAIKPIEDNLIPDPTFDLANMIKARREPITDSYKFIRKIGAGTYAEVF